MNRTNKENPAQPYGQKAACAIYEVIEMLAFTVMTVLLLTVLVTAMLFGLYLPWWRLTGFL